jgi:hypothetical protein
LQILLGTNFVSSVQQVLQHEIHQLLQYNLIVDTAKTILDNSLIRRWISISWQRQTETLDFYAFDVGLVTDVKDGKVCVDYKDEGVHAAPLKSGEWNCSTIDLSRRQHRWCMLAKKAPKQMHWLIKEECNLCNNLALA